MKKTLTVHCNQNSYPIYIGSGLLGQLHEHLPSKDMRAIVITDDVVGEHYLGTVCQSAGISTEDVFTFVHGEKSKTFETAEQIYTFLLERAVSRDALIIALGGGVVGDLAGFVAATYLRGVAFVQLPTSLLAQVDSAVGGKTGVNHPLGKNMVGAFYQPQCVVSDLNTLETLPAREFTSALAEIIKYGLILDGSFFAWLEDNLKALQQRDKRALVYAIYHSCRIKAEVVARDERELSGHRALLNLGHTFGHAFETCLGYGRWLHGEAVGCGMVFATKLSAKRGLIDTPTARRVTHLIERAQLPLTLPSDVDIGNIMQAMRLDKKNLQAKQRLILLRSIGEAFIDETTSPSDIQSVLCE